MKQILVSGQVAYAAKNGGGTISGINELDQLATGAIAIFTDQNELVTTTNPATTLSDRKKFYIAVGNQTDSYSKSIVSVLIPREGTNYSKKVYTAPVKTKKFIGYDGTTVGTALGLPTLVAGDSGQIKVTDTSLGLRNFAPDTKRYEEVVKTGDTDLTFLTRLIAKITDDPDAIVTPALINTDDGISLEAKQNGVTFAISVSGILANATIVEKEGSVTGVAVAPTYGEGTAEQIAALEDEAKIERGDTNRLIQPSKWFNTTSLVGAALTYDVYSFNWSGVRQSALVNQDTYNQIVRVALPLGGTTPKTAFETIMVEVFGGMHSTSDVETGS